MQENPQAYLARWGAQLLDANLLLQQARAAGVVEDIVSEIDLKKKLINKILIVFLRLSHHQLSLLLLAQAQAHLALLALLALLVLLVLKSLLVEILLEELHTQAPSNHHLSPVVRKSE